MNLQSMTGFALVRHEHPLGAVVLEIRSVNSRFLDPAFRISDELRSGESVLRESLTARLSRGKLDCRFYLQRGGQHKSGLHLNRDVALQLSQLGDEVRQLAPAAAALSVSEILHWPGILEDRELNAEEVPVLARSMAQQAIDELIATRGREGAKLGAMIIERVQSMAAIVERISPRIAELVTSHQQKLEERLFGALGLSPADKQAQISGTRRDEILDRIRQEVTLFGVRIDVAEELSRLSVHLSETERIISAGGPCGKRLDFMMQELNREANTLGSKAAAAELADAAMSLKLLIEQMREQVQNLE
jgi:uncharacterized protein (TIGR00255 family)